MHVGCGVHMHPRVARAGRAHLADACPFIIDQVVHADLAWSCCVAQGLPCQQRLRDLGSNMSSCTSSVLHTRYASS